MTRRCGQRICGNDARQLRAFISLVKLTLVLNRSTTCEQQVLVTCGSEGSSKRSIRQGGSTRWRYS